LLAKDFRISVPENYPVHFTGLALIKKLPEE
jgi:hypothetical protein